MVSRRQLRAILAALMLTLLLAALDQTIVATALPTISSDLGGLDSLSWIVTAYLLAATASTPIWGKLSDRHGRKLMLQASVAVFIAGSALAAISQGLPQLVAARAVQGLGGGGIMVLVLVVIADLVPPRQRGRYAGLFGAVFGLASILGPLLGGYFTEHLTWRWIFYINIPLGIAAFGVLAAVLHLPARRERKPIDWTGAILLVVGVVMTLLALVWADHPFSWHSPQILGLFVGGLVILAVFVVHELRAPEPLVNMNLFRNPVFRVSSAVGFIVGFTMLGSIIFLSVYLQLVGGASPMQAGLQLLPFMVGILLTSVVSGRLITRTGRYKVYPIAGTATATLGLLLLSRLSVDPTYAQLALGMFVLGAGLGGVMQVLVVAMQNSVDVAELGSATSASTLIRSMGSSFGAAGFGAVWGASLAYSLNGVLPAGVSLPDLTDVTASLASIDALPQAIHDSAIGALAHATSITFLAAVPIMLIAFVLTLFLPEVDLRRVHEIDTSHDSDATAPLPTLE